MVKVRTEEVQIPDTETEPSIEGTGAQTANGQERSADDGNSGASDTTNAESGGTGGSINAGGTGTDTARDPASALGETYTDEYANDPRIIRDEHGRPTFSPTGRVRRYRRATLGDSPTSATAGQRKPKEKVSLADLKENIETNSSILWGMHKAVAMLGLPEAELNPTEAEILATPITPILMRNDIQPPQWVKDVNSIIMACTIVYGPRVYTYRERKKAERRAKDEAKRRAADTTLNVGVADPTFFAPVLDPNSGPLGRH